MRVLATHCAGSSVHEVGGYSVRISDAIDDPEWDDYLERTPLCAYTQASCWGRVRAFTGWRPARVVVSEHDRIVAGVQILTRPLPAGGSVGRVSWGPVVREDAPELVELVFDEMLALGKAYNVQYLVVHPPRGGDWMCAELARRGFRPSLQEIEYTATVCVDLEANADELLARMSRRCREHIKLAERRGVTVRRASEADLPIFNQLKDAHCARLGYSRRDERYYAELWAALAPRGHIELFLAEYDGVPISAEMAIVFGDTSYHHERLWSGQHGDLRPNEILEWYAFKWAKAEGYRWVDLVGIQRSVAEAMIAGDRAPAQLTSAESFKLRLGAEPILLPEGYDYVYNSALRFVHRSIPSEALTSGTLRGLVDRISLRAWGGRKT